MIYSKIKHNIRSLHDWKGVDRPRARPNPETYGKLLRFAGLFGLSLIWRRNWLGIHLPFDGKTVCRLRKEVKTRVCDLPGATRFHCRGRALQLDSDDPYNTRAFRLRLYGRQRSNLRHLPPKSQYRATKVEIFVIIKAVSTCTI